MITLIVARALNGAIGRNNTIPWRASEDLRMFQRETLGGGLIMGRRTWESLPKRPLEGRLNCVISRDRNVADLVFPNVSDAIEACRKAGYQRIYGIGGQAIYRDLLPLANRLLITEVDLDVEDADAWFPGIDENAWVENWRGIIRDASPKCTLRELLRAC
ncbi:MAG: dihydrofolate reductase [Cypionkella sp.]